MAKTSVGKALEKFLQKKIDSIYALEAEISIGEYEGTLTREDVEKLRKKLNNKTKDLDDMNTTLESYEVTIDVADTTIKVQEGIAVANPTGGPSAAALLLREKSKEVSDDLSEVIKEQGKSAIKQALDGLKNAREALNNIGKK
jgi:septal ring factor EnvC (AmiA/AmiB activator)